MMLYQILILSLLSVDRARIYILASIVSKGEWRGASVKYETTKVLLWHKLQIALIRVRKGNAS